MVIGACRRGCDQAGREPGEIVLQGLAAAVGSDDAALASSREWKGTLVDDNYAEDVHDPAHVGALAEEKTSDRVFKMMGIRL
ncbi:hypothetical protein [Spirillospora sp. NPDC048819]|uniref:hypothetical protein n=1 Tax=Spirillospora sp. NPDC048819 TaxID=3155268 RepID=UPI0033E154B8